MNKGFARLIFLVVFLLPVAWYLILQLFGSNNFSLALQYPVDSKCGKIDGITIVHKSDSLSLVKRNYFDRVVFSAEKRSVAATKKDQNFFDCIDQSDADLVLINEEGLWGAYELSRKGVDDLLTELDILLLQQSYGQGTSR